MAKAAVSRHVSKHWCMRMARSVCLNPRRTVARARTPAHKYVPKDLYYSVVGV